VVNYRGVLQHRKRGKQKRSGLPWYVLAGAAIVVVMISGVFLFRSWHHDSEPTEVKPVVPEVPAVSAPVPPFRAMVYPTPQANLLASNGVGVLQPTASGRPESGGFGSVRVGRFHEGIDIAATKRDRAGRPLDQVRAVARGTVGYINRVAGNSNYGIYVALVHDDPMGPVYTLYAHLSEVASGLSIGKQIDAGTVLGTMGNTPVSIIPRTRGHLHFEIGLLSNSRFQEWFRRQRLKPDHGVYNGWNLMGINPLVVFAAYHRDPDSSFLDILKSIPQAFEMVVATSKQLDFFRRYPQLWEGDEYDGGPMVIACSENGIPLSGRNASADEKKSLARSKAIVLKADGTVLGTNGDHLVEREGRGGWRPGSHSQQWLEILTY